MARVNALAIARRRVPDGARRTCQPVHAAAISASTIHTSSSATGARLESDVTMGWRAGYHPRE